MKKYNKLTPAEEERLALLAEELGETIQAIGKILRHGYEKYHPNSLGITNRTELEKELGHVWAAMNLMEDNGDIEAVKIVKHTSRKTQDVKKWLHHQEVRKV